MRGGGVHRMQSWATSRHWSAAEELLRRGGEREGEGEARGVGGGRLGKGV